MDRWPTVQAYKVESFLEVVTLPESLSPDLDAAVTERLTFYW